MIAVSSSSRSFAVLGKYLVFGREKVDEGRVAWTSARNLPTENPQLAAKIMRATASQNVRVSRPVYHLALSFDPRDVVDRAMMERAVDRVLEELGLKEHQAIIVAHADRAHSHMHILVNRIHPETGRAWDRWQDQAIIQRALREQEKVLGVRAVEASLDVHQQDREGTRREVTSAGEMAPERTVGRSARGGDRLSMVNAEFDAYEGAVGRAQQRYSAERDVATADARLTRVQAAVERVEQASGRFDAALARGYRDPDAAKAGFLDAAAKRGERDAVRAMRDTPEVFGQVAGVDTRRDAFGRSHAPAESSLAAAREAAGYGAELTAAKADIVKLCGLTKEAEHGALSRVTQQSCDVALAQVQLARNRLEFTRHVEKTMPSRDQVEFRLLQALRRLSPPEFEKLRFTLSAQRFSLAYQLRQKLRDAVLGRDDEQ